MTVFHDVQGNVVDVGDTVAYAAGGKYAGHLRVGKFVRRTTKKDWRGEFEQLVINYPLGSITKGMAMAAQDVRRAVLKINPEVPNADATTAQTV